MASVQRQCCLSLLEFRLTPSSFSPRHATPSLQYEPLNAAFSLPGLSAVPRWLWTRRRCASAKKAYSGYRAIRKGPLPSNSSSPVDVLRTANAVAVRRPISTSFPLARPYGFGQALAPIPTPGILAPWQIALWTACCDAMPAEPLARSMPRCTPARSA